MKTILRKKKLLGLVLLVCGLIAANVGRSRVGLVVGVGVAIVGLALTWARDR